MTVHVEPERASEFVSSKRTTCHSNAVTAWTTLSVGTWAAVVGLLAIERHREFLSHRFDLGNMVQAVWNTTQGRPLEMTDGASGEQITRLAAHVDPILVLLSPLPVVFGTPEALIAVQSVALAAGLYPVIRLAAKHLEHPLAVAMLGVWYLAYPWIIWNAFNDFHPVTLAIPLLLYAVWYLDEHRLGRFAVVACLAVLTGELVGLTVAALGIWYAVQHRCLRSGAFIALLGAAWTTLCLIVIVPYFNEGSESRYYSFFDDVGGSPVGILKTLVRDPGLLLSAVTSTEDILYLLLLLAPSAFLVLVQPLLLLVGFPQLAVNLLSSQPSSTLPWFQYVAPIAPALIAATVLAVGRLPRALQPAAGGVALFAAVSTLALAPPRPGTDDWVFGPWESETRLSAMREAVGLVPGEASVTATNRLGAHLSARRVIHLFPARSRAEWAVLDMRDVWLHNGRTWGTDADLFRSIIRDFEAEPGWKLVFDRQDVRVYRRAGEPPPVLEG